SSVVKARRVAGFAVVSATIAVVVPACSNPPRLPPASAGDAVTARPTVDAGAAPPFVPVVATFLDPTNVGAPVTVRACESVVIAVAKGSLVVFGESLAPSDSVLVRGRQTFEVKGDGLALAVVVTPKVCDANDRTPPTHDVVRGGDVPELSWASGTMHASLDRPDTGSGLAYFGRLRGSAPVAEHDHGSSWEVLAAVDAAGTFTLDGVPHRLGSRGIVVVPPGTRHAWAPDVGSNLVAFQVYAPPGPERRFVALAADGGTASPVVPAADAGPRPDAGSRNVPGSR
ncbi:MAG: hypothetical protein U0169_19980, partial [Polyangiaceae bacterium]